MPPRIIAVLLGCVLIMVGCGSSLSIPSDVFVSSEDGTAANEVVRLSGTFDPEVAVDALRRAGARFMLVDDKGMEYATEEDVEAAEQRYPAGSFYTPNYVGEPKVLDGGIELYVDCKGVIPPPMAATFRRILREELRRARVTNAKVRNVPEI